jgi:hypothetical protein
MSGILEQYEKDELKTLLKDLSERCTVINDMLLIKQKEIDVDKRIGIYKQAKASGIISKDELEKVRTDIRKDLGLN